MIKQIRHYFDAKSRAAEFSAKKDEIMMKLLEETSNIVTERPDSGGWITSAVTDREKGHLQTNQLDMIRNARRVYRWDSNMRAVIETLIHYIMGKGISITPKEKDPMVWYTWREFWTAERNEMQLRQFELVWRLFRDGEVFIEMFSADERGMETGKTTLRFIDPLLVKNPGGTPGSETPRGFNETTTKAGIEHDTEDVETVIKYWVQSRQNADKFRSVPAARMIHIKIFADSDQKRGETYVQPVMQLFTHYRQWLENRVILNKMRTAIVMIKKIEGTAGDVSRLASTIGSAKRSRMDENKKEQLRGGTIITAGPGVDYRMESPNINATDVKEDGRNIKLAIAAGTNLPEYVFGDASNANYSSSLVAESPFVKGIQYWQMFLEHHLGKIFKRVIQNAADAGVVTPPSDEEFLAKLKNAKPLEEQEVPPKDEDGEEQKPEKETPSDEDIDLKKMETPTERFFGCDMQWPEVIHRDPKDHAEALQVARTNGWVSDPTCAAALGWDWIEEVRKQNQAEEAAKEDGNALMGIKSSEDLELEADEMDDEISNVLHGLTDEERRKILTSTNPKDLVSLIGKHAPPK